MPIPSPPEVSLPSSAGRIQGIDALRALAVLSVVVYHLDDRWLPGGFAGVDIFFVISGYVVTRTFASHRHEGLIAYLSGFYARRVRRILPALLVCLLVTGTADVALVPQAWLSSQNVDTARYALLGVSNLFLSRNQESYFSPRIEFNPYAHTWSLGVEEQFYIVLPFLYFFTLRTATSRRSLVWLAIPVVCVLSMAASAWLSVEHSPSAYYELTSRFWELGAGALLAERHRRHAGRLVPLGIVSPTLLAVSAFAAFATGLMVSGWFLFPFPTALLVVVGSIVLIDHLACGSLHRLWSPAWMPIIYIGTISYSIYLWHWPVFSLFRWTVGLDDLPKRTIALATVALLSVLGYHFVERPFQRQSLRTIHHFRVIGIGIAAVVGSWFIADLLRERQSQLSLSVTRDTRTWYPYNYSARRAATGCHSTQHGEPFERGSRILIDRRDCESPEAWTTLFVAGDSHAGAYMTMLGSLVADAPYRVEIYTLPGCPFFTLQSPSSRVSAECTSFVSATIAEIGRHARRGDVLFLPSLRLQRMTDQWGDVVDADAAISAGERQRQRDAAIDEARVDLAGLDALGVAVIFEAPKPVFGAPAFRCADPFNSMNPVCAPGFERDAAALQAQRAPVIAGMRRVQRELPGVRIWDPFPILCPSSTCNAFDGAVPLFFDGDHLSASGNRMLYPDFAAFLEEIAQHPMLQKP